MQSTYGFLKPGEFEVNSRQFGFRVMKRDLDILQFILEMKFSTLEDIHSKFFKVTQSGEISTSDWWARERVTGLAKSGFIRKFKTLSMKIFYVMTLDGYYFLKSNFPMRTFCRPLIDIDIRTLDHDLLVQKLRLSLEQNGIAKDWQSERALGEIPEVRTYLSKEFRPDGIYINQENQKVAFELERTRKEKSRYQDKIKRYLQIMRSKEPGTHLFDRVHYICLTNSIRDILSINTRLYGELFKVQTTEEFFKTHNTIPAKENHNDTT